ncbi:MAG: 5-oxoprolinase subunit PxpB [Pyrinomonadaceae bacterium]|nr:5-oxoprolinase subunit PxpB [Pyrinomonadaceae bacterium]
MNYRIFPISDHALTVEFGSEISVALNNSVLNLADFLDRNSFPGLIEIVPAYASLSFFYDVRIVRRNFPAFPTAFEAVKNFTENALKNLNDCVAVESRSVKIPVSFDKESALDLEYVAQTNNLSPEKVIQLFLARTYRVYMLGFLPGFSYMGEVDGQIATPRKDSPRLRVSKGSVGIAGKQTGIYSLESPGGWQIIGSTNVELFTPNEEKLTFLQAGDSVKFYRTSF